MISLCSSTSELWTSRKDEFFQLIVPLRLTASVNVPELWKDVLSGAYRMYRYKLFVENEDDMKLFENIIDQVKDIRYLKICSFDFGWFKPNYESLNRVYRKLGLKIKQLDQISFANDINCRSYELVYAFKEHYFKKKGVLSIDWENYRNDLIDRPHEFSDLEPGKLILTENGCSNLIKLHLSEIAHLFKNVHTVEFSDFSCSSQVSIVKMLNLFTSPTIETEESGDKIQLIRPKYLNLSFNRMDKKELHEIIQVLMMQNEYNSQRKDMDDH
jgi:hypothetical protein